VAEIGIYGSIRSVDPADLGASAERLLEAGVDGIHVDVADGVFVPELTFGPAVARSLVARTRAAVEVHLMVVDPERYLRELADAGIARVAFHVEATGYPWRVCSLARSLGLVVGIAANPATPIGALAAVAEAADYVTLLTTEPDLAGERLLPGSEERVAAVRAALAPESRLEVDGGVDAAAVLRLAAAGAQDFVVGRAVTASEQWEQAVRGLRAAAEPAVRVENT
jgi:ribulose-phosphate 3-epimerase